ncbi:MAG: hypothetical protein GF347_03945 [Candidatus Moranbacteria bacterium]|nr:hypothetical protein [Candidatus Moranbacteria bacterium]
MPNFNISREDLERRKNRGLVDPAYRGRNLAEEKESASNRADLRNPSSFNRQSPSDHRQSRDQFNYEQNPNRSQNNQFGAYSNQGFDKRQEDGEMKRIISYGLGIVILLTVIAGGLYLYSEFFLKKEQDQPIAEPEPEAEPESIPSPPEEQEVELPKDTEYKKHILVAKDKHPLNVIDFYHSKIEKGDKIVEFVFFDEKGDSFNFFEFAERVDLNISEDLEYLFGEDYYFILTPIVNSQGKSDLSIGIIIDSKYSDPDKIEENLRKWEETMAKDLGNFLFFYENIKIENPDELQFNDSSKFEEVRYVNLPNNDDFSINYFVEGDKIVIVNSFYALEGVREYVKMRSE